MERNDADHLLDEIAQLLAEDSEYPHQDTLLHAEVGKNYVGPSIFKDCGDHILYRDPDLDRLGDALLDLWETQPSDKRWAEMEYIVQGNRFRAIFTYPDEIDAEESSLDRRSRIVRRHFGDKRIIYPPPPRGVMKYSTE